MKFQVTFKCPDAVEDAIKQELKHEEFESELAKRYAVEDFMELTRKWVEWGEYITVEFDLDAGTCVVAEC